MFEFWKGEPLFYGLNYRCSSRAGVFITCLDIPTIGFLSSSRLSNVYDCHLVSGVGGIGLLPRYQVTFLKFFFFPHSSNPQPISVLWIFISRISPFTTFFYHKGTSKNGESLPSSILFFIYFWTWPAYLMNALNSADYRILRNCSTDLPQSLPLL